MERYEFRIALFPVYKGLDVSFADWQKEGIDPTTCNVAVVILEAENWWSFPAREPEVHYGGDMRDYTIVFLRELGECTAVGGYTINPERFTPSKLYDGLCQMPKYRFAVDGNIPTEPAEDPYKREDKVELLPLDDN